MGDAEAVGCVCSEMSYQLLWAARPEEALHVANRGLNVLAEPLSAERCRLLTLAGLSHSFGGDYEAGDPLVSQALTMAEELGDQHLLGEVFCYTSLVLHAVPRAGGGRPASDRITA